MLVIHRLFIFRSTNKIEIYGNGSYNYKYFCLRSYQIPIQLAFLLVLKRDVSLPSRTYSYTYHSHVKQYLYFLVCTMTKGNGCLVPRMILEGMESQDIGIWKHHKLSHVWNGFNNKKMKTNFLYFLLYNWTLVFTLL